MHTLDLDHRMQTQMCQFIFYGNSSEHWLEYCFISHLRPCEGILTVSSESCILFGLICNKAAYISHIFLVHLTKGLPCLTYKYSFKSLEVTTGFEPVPLFEDRFHSLHLDIATPVFLCFQLEYLNFGINIAWGSQQIFLLVMFILTRIWV